MNCVGIHKDMYIFLIHYPTKPKAKTKTESEIELIKRKINKFQFNKQIIIIKMENLLKRALYTVFYHGISLYIIVKFF